eukprot:838919-Lingulodinium_polyedra.AAC.1
MPPGIVVLQQLPELAADSLLRLLPCSKLLEVLLQVAPAEGPRQTSSWLQHPPPYEVEAGVRTLDALALQLSPCGCACD